MIRFTLKCSHGHDFEAWFKDGASYDAQAAGGEVVCPACGDTGVAKAIMAPHVARSRAAPDGPESAKAQVRQELAELRRAVEQNCEHVGERFAEEARRIHYGESEKRGIYGEATAAEAAALTDEGISFNRVPWPTRTDS